LARNIAAVAVVAALLTAATAGAQAFTGGGAGQAPESAKYGFRVFPRVGTPATTFRVTFTAPFPADGRNTDYTLEGVGPPRCASLFEFSQGRTRRGDRVVLTLTPDDDLFLRIRPRWCPGSYVGYVYHAGPAFRTPLIGYFSFGVGRSPVSLAP
jgi:hypothetical protein